LPIRKHVIHAVHDLDLDELLRNLGLLEPLKNGELRCNICGCQVNRKNLGCLYPNENDVRICCIKLSCLEKVMIQKREEIPYG
jgi:hypothetical protein